MSRNFIGLTVAGIVMIAYLALASNEITVNTYLRVNNGSFDLFRSVSGYQVDQTGKAMSYAVSPITDATNALAINASVTTAGYAYMRNVGTGTIYVAIGSGAAFLMLNTNDVFLGRMASTNVVAWTPAGYASILEHWINQE